MDASLALSIKRIKTWGPDSPMLHNDALKLVEHVESYYVNADSTAEDILDDPGYQEFVERQRKYCRCTSRVAPCEGVLAGGMCDNIQDDPDDETRCLFCSSPDCSGDCEEFA